MSFQLLVGELINLGLAVVDGYTEMNQVVVVISTKHQALRQF